MRNWLAALAPWMVTTAALAQSPTVVKVDYTYLGTFTEESVRIQDECWVTPALLQKWGFKTISLGDRVDVTVDDRKFDLPVYRHESREFVNFSLAVRYIGAEAEWNAAKDTFFIRAQVRNVERTERGIRIDSTLPVKAVISKVPAPDRLVIDLAGARIPLGLAYGIPPNWRIRQFEKDTVRVVVESPDMAKQFLPTLEPARTISLIFGDEAAQVEPIEYEGSTAGMVEPEPLENFESSALPKPTISLSMPNLAKEDETSATFMMPFTGKLAKPPSAKFLDPKRIQLTVPLGEVSSQFTTQLFESKFALSAQGARDEKGNAIVVFDLHERAAFELKSNDKIVTMRFYRPKQASGKLADKVVVVDAGHGGSETGTKWKDIFEKDITLKISKKLAAYLVDEGASVVMIRDDDSTVPLLSRPETANQSRADLYVSVHINSNQTAGSVTGGITFYHMQDSVSMLLARCIQSQIAAVSKIPDMGVWSDSRIYKRKGFAVLRGASMPAVLIELGFLNHPTDRKRILEKEFQDDAAQAIVRGIKDFLGEGSG